MEKLSKEYTYKILQCAYNVHTELGPGLLESIYEEALVYELQSNGFEVKRQMPVKVRYKEIVLPIEFRIDIMVDDCVVIELKSVSEVLPIHKKQLMTYLRLTNKKLGYVINFNEISLRDGIERIISDIW